MHHYVGWNDTVNVREHSAPENPNNPNAWQAALITKTSPNHTLLKLS
jgi:hypothetical protein